MRLEIQVNEIQPLAGRVSADDQPPVAFCGWLALLGILERLAASAPVAAQRPGDELDA